MNDWGQWYDVYDVLIEHCGALPRERDDCCSAMNSRCREYRFQGSLGMGGKLYNAHGKMYVSCYSEDRTPARDAAIAAANAKLAAMAIPRMCEI